MPSRDGSFTFSARSPSAKRKPCRFCLPFPPHLAKINVNACLHAPCQPAATASTTSPGSEPMNLLNRPAFAGTFTALIFGLGLLVSSTGNGQESARKDKLPDKSSYYKDV